MLIIFFIYYFIFIITIYICSLLLSILAVVSKQWIPLPEENDQDGMYEFGVGYEPMELRVGMVLRLKEGIYNDNNFKEDEEEEEEDIYFSPLRRKLGTNGQPLINNDIDSIDLNNVKVLYGYDTTTNTKITGIFPSNCIRLIRVYTTFRNIGKII